jgi:starch synthase (maltosyl-transferring)
MKESPSQDGRQRVIIESVTPEIDAGRFPARRVQGDEVVVEADIFTDGHDAVDAVLLHWKEGEKRRTEVPLRPSVNDRWRASFRVDDLGRHRFTIEAWIDPFRTWRQDFGKRVEAVRDAAAGGGADLAVHLLAGAALVREAAGQARGDDAASLRKWADRLGGPDGDVDERAALALHGDLEQAMERNPLRRFPVTYDREPVVIVEPERARFSAWYEMFPRSASGEAGRHGTFRDVERRLPYVAELGFDVLYLPPIHPIGRSFRKGRNNTLDPGPADPGSPWAIGSEEGGHKAIHPQLGTLEDFRRLVSAARALGIEIALDVALQASPDHPYVKSHPEWFRSRPDGTIQYAENPPKKYQDIYPFDFESPGHEEMWRELKSIFDFWIAQGVTIFRVDNPHTKSLRFWEWCLAAVRSEHPGTIFLAEAFTRPKLMHYLAKAGFSQSYTYFPWRNTAAEIADYCRELRSRPLADYFRPNHWTNTPDILTSYLQFGGRPAFVTRLVLAATLGASYGIYGPAFELMDSRAAAEGSEEYLDSEKYQIRRWDLERPDSLRGIIARVNRIRRENPVLSTDEGLHFHACDNEAILCYSKGDSRTGNAVLVAVNLDPHHTRAGRVSVDTGAPGLEGTSTLQLHDLLSDTRFTWRGSRGYVELDPSAAPARILRLRRRVRTEADFEYYY